MIILTSQQTAEDRAAAVRWAHEILAQSAARLEEARSRRPPTLAEMTPDELASELQDVEVQRQMIKYRRGPQASQTKDWARRRKANIRSELKRRGLPTGGRRFQEWAGASNG
jgi:hypothetical protein